MYNLEEINHVRDFLIKHQQSIACAESVTSGHLQAAFSLAEDASLFYQGGITAYNIIQKYCHFHINPSHAIACNCVSETIAAEMAKSTCKLFSSTWGISVTGYASIVPEHTKHGLFACYSIAFKGNEIKTATVNAAESTPLNVQLLYTNFVIKELAEVLKIRTIQE